MILFALLLAGIVAVNVAVLRAHVAVTQLDQQREKLQAREQGSRVPVSPRQLRAADRGVRRAGSGSSRLPP